MALDPVQNSVVVGKKEDLYQPELSIGEVNWIAGQKPDLPHEFSIKIRYRHKVAPAQLMEPENGVYSVRFAEPQMAITPGQFAVFYNDDEVIGGGVIL